MSGYLRIDIEHLLFFIFFSTFFLFHESLGYDFYWHLKTGEYIFQNGAIPFGDPFSFPNQGKPWTLHEWLFEYFLYLLHSHTGLYGVKLLTSALLTLAVFIVYRSAVSLGGNKYLLLLLSGISFYLLSRFGLPRPQIFTYLFLAIYLYILLGFKYRSYSVRLTWIPLIMILWVNIHAGYVIGLVLLVIFILAELFDRNFSTDFRDQPDMPLTPLLVATLLCIVASLLNPYTYHHLLYPFYMMSLSAHDLIVEWKSPNFHLPVFKLYLLYVFSYIFLRNYVRKAPQFLEIALPLSMIILSLISRRHIPIATLTLLPFFSLTLHESVKSFHLPPRFKALHSIKKYLTIHHQENILQKPGKLSLLHTWLLMSSLIALTLFYHNITDKRIEYYESERLPVGAVNFIKEMGIKGNVLNQFGAGGYLINSLYPSSKVFIDGRADLHGTRHVSISKTIMTTGPNWEKYFNEYNFDYIICSNSAPITWHLSQTDEFSLIYRDLRNSIYLKNNDKHKPIIEKLGNSYISRSRYLIN